MCGQLQFLLLSGIHFSAGFAPLELFIRSVVIIYYNISAVAVLLHYCCIMCVDEDWLHEAAGTVPVTCSYTAICLTSQPYDWFPGETCCSL